MLTSSTQLQKRSFHVIERTRTSSKCQKMKNARAKRANILFFIVKCANLWGLCSWRRLAPRKELIDMDTTVPFGRAISSPTTFFEIGVYRTGSYAIGGNWVMRKTGIN